MLIAALGDVHGKWRRALTLVEWACADVGVATSDLAAVFQVGDAEALRSDDEVAQVPGPSKYRKLGDYAQVLDGTILVPAPLYFIAGNHEPFAALDSDGGLVAGHGRWGPGVTYLGRAGAVMIDGLRVGFLSGIWGERTSDPRARPHQRTGREAGHYSAAELATALRATEQGGFDVLITHDWPAGLPVERGCTVGDTNVRRLAEASRAALSLHGHMHISHRGMIGVTEVACLSQVGRRGQNPLDAVGIWQISADGSPARRLA